MSWAQLQLQFVTNPSHETYDIQVMNNISQVMDDFRNSKPF